MYICVPLCVFVCVSVKCPRRPKTLDVLELGLLICELICELPDVDTGTGNGTQVLGRGRASS